ncbi:hypothetical protein OG851_23080 [Streptomyces sp. NBC_00161]|uniref:hypothetical protein n=1 Tax=Streptomyces sp. NBC_00161 TaxID=2975671 RepID=UPI00324DA2E7
MTSAFTPHALAAARTSSFTAPYGGRNSFGSRPKAAANRSPAPHTSAERFYEAGAKKAGLRYVQGTGVRLPTGPEVDAYAKADIPFYVVADRRHDEVVVCRDPCRGPGR